MNQHPEVLRYEKNKDQVAYEYNSTWDNLISLKGEEIKIYDYYLVSSDELYSLDDSKNHNFDYNYYLEASIS